MKERQSNFELLRIVLMVSIPLYHLMLYSGMNNQPFNSITVPSLLICSGSAIVADYAFMAMTSYFFQQSENKKIFQKLLKLVIQVLFMYLIKIVILRYVIDFSEDWPLYKGFFYKGSWWFIYTYIIMLCIHPYLNKLIKSLKTKHIQVICLVLGVCFTINGVLYKDNLLNDLIAFMFTYFFVAYLNRRDFKSLCGIKNCRKNMLLIYLIGYIVTFFLCLIFNLKFAEENNYLAIEIIRRVIGKYAIQQFFMGIAVFLLFKSITIPYNKRINAFAKNVFYVFLLHETVMAIFWHFDKLLIVEDILPYDNVFSMIIWCAIYIICSFMFAIIVRWIYEHTIKLLVDKIITNKTT